MERVVAGIVAQILVGALVFVVFVGARALFAARAGVPGRLPPFGEAPRAVLARLSLLGRLALTLAGPVAVYLLATAFVTADLRRTGTIIPTSTLVEVWPGMAADAAGMQDGDRIRAVAGAPVTRFADLAGALAPHAGKSVDILVERDGQNVHLAVTPGPVGSRSPGKIGVRPRPEALSIGAAVRAALPRPLDLMVRRFEAARQPRADLMGPIGITHQTMLVPSVAEAVVVSAAAAAATCVDGLLLVALFLFPFRRRGELAQSPEPPGIGRPWPRFAARIIDIGAFGLAVVVALAVVHPALVDAVGASLFLLTIPIEAALLASWGTTPGKALLGISVRDAAGRKLSLGSGLRRAAAVWMYGLAANLPIGVVTGVLAVRRLRRDRVAYWDAVDSFRVEHREVSGARHAVAVTLVGLFLLGVVAVAHKEVTGELMTGFTAR